MELLPRPDDVARRGVLDPRDTPPLLIRLVCQGELHHIEWHRGHVSFLDHNHSALEFEAVIGPDTLTACGAVLVHLRTGEEEPPYGAVPLFEAIQRRRAIRSGYGYGNARPTASAALRISLCEALASKIAAPMLAALDAEGLRADLEVNAGAAEDGVLRFTLVAPDTRKRLLSFRLHRHTWTAASPQDLERIASARSQASTSGTWAEGAHCRVCQAGQAAPHTLHLGKHARQAAHRERFVAAFERAIYRCHRAQADGRWYRNVQGLAANFDAFLWRMERTLGPRPVRATRAILPACTQLPLVSP